MRSRRSRRQARWVWAAALAGTSLFAQAGSVRGVITNPEREGVPAIPVQLKDTNSGKMYEATTSDSGQYVVAGLPAGTYDLTVPAVGFTLERFEKKALAVHAGEATDLDIAMLWSGNLGTPGDDPSIYLRSRYANTAGPTPRTHEGKPDLSGVWTGNDDPNPVDPDAFPEAAALAKKRREDRDIDSPSTHCLPSSMPPFGPLIWKLVQTPALLVMLFEDLPGVRQIYLDGRAHPKDWKPTWMGHSVGHWDGDTLVVDSVGFNNRSWLGDYSHTEQLHVIERYTRRDLGHLAVQVVMEDPGTFLKPWTVNMVWNLAPGEEMLEYVCTENNRDIKHLLGK